MCCGALYPPVCSVECVFFFEKNRIHSGVRALYGEARESAKCLLEVQCRRCCVVLIVTAVSAPTRDLFGRRVAPAASATPWGGRGYRRRGSSGSTCDTQKSLTHFGLLFICKKREKEKCLVIYESDIYCCYYVRMHKGRLPRGLHTRSYQ